MRLAKRVSATIVEGRYALLNEDSGKYWELNSTATDILKQLLEGEGVEDVADSIAAQKDVKAEQVKQDAKDLIETLRKAELLDT